MKISMSTVGFFIVGFTLFFVVPSVFVYVFSGFASHNVLETSSGAGFFTGILHGAVAPYAMFTSIFVDGVSLYEVRNTGWWYNEGFVLGHSPFFIIGRYFLLDWREQERVKAAAAVQETVYPPPRPLSYYHTPKTLLSEARDRQQAHLNRTPTTL